MAVKRKCMVCGEEFERVRFGQVVCSPLCGVQYAAAQKDKAIKAAEAKAKREEKADLVARKRKLETLPELTKKAQAAFNRYIRVRDKGLPCISCGAPWRDTFQACHYVPAGRSNKLRFDEDNVHGGCVRCNLYESGNLRGYRIGLIAKIGAARVEAMEIDHEAKRFTHDELREIEDKYKRMAKEAGRGA